MEDVIMDYILHYSVGMMTIIGAHTSNVGHKCLLTIKSLIYSELLNEFSQSA